MKQTPTFKIGKRLIGENHKPLVIPEIGINHGGSIETAFKIVDAAKRTGAEIIKHQTHIPDDEMSLEAKLIKPGNAKENIYKIIKKNSLSEENEFKLFKYIKKKSLIFLSTPFSRLAVDRLIKFGVQAFKIGSGEFNNIPFLDYVMKFKLPIVVSTGMHSLQTVSKIVSYLKSKRANFCLLHTTNLYPTPDHLVRLSSLLDMKKKFPDKVIGLSDHTATNYSSFGAITLGASIIEKHFIDHRGRKGPDISASIDEKNLKDLINGVNILYLQRGGKKNYLHQEQVTRNFAFASVVSIENIKKGEIFTKKNIWVKRPGNGEIKADKFYKILGKKSKSNIKKNTQIKLRYLGK
jgi:N-acetylneuraminate synthase